MTDRTDEIRTQRGGGNTQPAVRCMAVRVPQAAQMLSIARSTAYALIQRGELPSIRVGKSLRVPVAALEAWVERQARQSAGEAADAPASRPKGGAPHGATHVR
jgi:excisionase family DNA binding protein